MQGYASKFTHLHVSKDELTGSGDLSLSVMQLSTRRYTSKLPVVRFGSTETCLQVMGTPISLSEASRYRVFEAGWANSFCGVAQKGYYIGK